MGTITKGILGGFSGQVGTVVGATWKGIEYMRSRPSRYNDAQSEEQLEQRNRFTFMMRFLQPSFSFLMTGFKTYAVRKTGINAALSYNIKNAIAGTYPSYQIAYNQVLMSRGDLPGAVNAAITSLDTGEVTFSWNDNSGIGKARATDKALLLVYSPTLKASIFTTAGAARSAGEQTFQVEDFSGESVYAWLGFMSEDGKEVATSVFVGQITVI